MKAPIKLYLLIYAAVDPTLECDVWPIFADTKPTAQQALKILGGLGPPRSPAYWKFYEDAIAAGDMDVEGPYALPAVAPDADAVLAALSRINARRRRGAQPLLDPAAQGWSGQDVLDEDDRLGGRPGNPVATKADLLR